MFQARQDYKAAYLGHMSSPSNNATLAAYLDAHNTYVTQLHATNGMVETYSRETLPLLLQVAYIYIHRNRKRMDEGTLIVVYLVSIQVFLLREFLFQIGP